MEHEDRPQRVTPAMRIEAETWNRKCARLAVWMRAQEAERARRRANAKIAERLNKGKQGRVCPE